MSDLFDQLQNPATRAQAQAALEAVLTENHNLREQLRRAESQVRRLEEQRDNARRRAERFKLRAERLKNVLPVE